MRHLGRSGSVAGSSSGDHVRRVIRRKTPFDLEMRQLLDIVAANERHVRSTRQCEEAAAELGLHVWDVA